MLTRHSLLCSLIVWAAPALAQAQETVLVGAAASVREAPGGEFAADLRWRSRDGVQIGALLDVGGFDVGYLGGYAERGVLSGGLGVVFLAPLVQSGPLTLDLRGVAGAAYLGVLEAARGPSSDALRARVELSMLGHVRLDPAWLLRFGATLGFDLEVTPTLDMADQAALVTAGLGFAPAPDWMLYAQVDAGGTFGFDGDNGKVILRGTAGVRVGLDGGEVRHGY
jgi:hypothetical protein